jgi:hypothetical protein
MASGPPDREGRFIEVGQSFLNVLLGSRAFLALSWMTFGKVLGDVASWCRLYLVAKPSHMGVDVDGLAYPLHHPMACYRQMRG